MFASGAIQSLFASGPSPACASLLERVRDTPSTDTVVVSRITVVPGVGEVIATVHDPVPPEVVQVFTLPTKPPGPDTIEKLITVPSGAFTRPAPFPLSTFT